MPDGNEAQQVLEFALQHKIILGSVGGTIVGFGFLAGRYVFDRQLGILKQENELLDERVKITLAELEAKTKVILAKSDPLEDVRIQERKEASNRGAAFRFFVSVAALVTLLLSGGCLYLLNQVTIRESEYYSEQAARQNELEGSLKRVEALVQPKVAATSSSKPRRADQRASPTEPSRQ
jgi:hypothetical protein